MKLATVLSTLSVSASLAYAAPASQDLQADKRTLASQKGVAQLAHWNAIVKQAGPDLIILCQGILPYVTDTAFESTTIYYPVTTVVTETMTELTTTTLTDIKTISEETTLIVPELTSVTSTAFATAYTTVTDATKTVPTATTTVITLGAPIPTLVVKRALTEDTRALFQGLYNANATFVIERCGSLYQPIHVTTTNTATLSSATPYYETTSVTETNTIVTIETTSTTETSTSTVTSTTTETIPFTATATVTAKATATVNSVETAYVCQPFKCPPSLGSGLKTESNYGLLKQDKYPECLYYKDIGVSGSFSCTYDFFPGTLASSGKDVPCLAKAQALQC